MSNEYEYDDNIFPLAYLITLRSFGTWLHGDNRGAVDRHGKNIYGTADIIPNPKLEKIMSENMKQSAVLFNKLQRKVIEKSIEEVCSHRNYTLQAVNCRSNHLHVVVSAQSQPESIMNAFKSYATRKLRESSLIDSEKRIWALKGSRRYLWKPRHVSLAIEYVLYGQGDIFFEIKTK
jgi:REP element-mobilizing transposase RayT